MTSLAAPATARHIARSAVRSRGRSFHAHPPSAVDGAFDPHNALVHLAPPQSRAGPSSAGPLAGWSASVKANICTTDMPTSCSSRMLQDYTSPFDATVVQRLRAAGAVIVGKTNCDEFGMGSANVHSVHGPVLNPAAPAATALGHNEEGGRQRHRKWHEPRVAGGSSGGAAASVRAGLCRVALASDTGGSIRLPASYCGVWGLKPSYGLLSRWGLVSYADSLDTVGILARSCSDISATFDALSAYDPKDPSAIPENTRKQAAEVVNGALPRAGSLSGVRVGVPREYFPAELEPQVVPAVQRALARLRDAGATLHSVSLPSTPLALSTYYVLASAEASSNLARYDGVRYGHRSSDSAGIDEGSAHPYAATRSEGFGAEAQRRILLGTYALTADAFDNYFLQAQRTRLRIQHDFDSVLRLPSVLRSAPGPCAEGVDVLLSPSSVRTAPTLKSMMDGDGGALPQDAAARASPYVQDVLTVPASLAGLPALSVPAGVAEDGWPVGVSLTTQWGCEPLLWRVGQALEPER